MNNPATRQQWIYDELLKEPATSYVEMFRGYSENFRKSERTFTKDWEPAKTRHEAYQNKANEAKEASAIAKEVEGLERGIKSKTERVLALQKQADAAEADLERGTVTQIKIIAGGKATIERPMDVYEKVALAKVYKDLIAEISKLQGDYAPEKKDITISGGVDEIILEE